MNKLRTSLLGVCLVLTGCGSMLNATRSEPIDDDRSTRTFGRKIDDSLIETKASVNIAKADPNLETSHIVVASYNGVLLIAGQTPRQELKEKAGQAASNIQGVKLVHNELQILAPSSGLARSNDAWLTTKIKTQMLGDGTTIKVITENGIVYLMGLVTQQQGNLAASTAQGVSGVQRVVKLFEYID
ncbi:BON domain-containing protein [Azomonas macrocytogenes]|uniref:Osmotically-inducible protein OsmY n=1 Tax=Azomonas macrocytogenes TaxID=69962 RepID=A0A839T8U5_AZOMA|nr:BON domain-containing protein [Azomonas macrocytogenes]MBB3104654.1 osmotically-inducible protein OsmY [Azomonas macrocytogenes]